MYTLKMAAGNKDIKLNAKSNLNVIKTVAREVELTQLTNEKSKKE